MSRRCHTVLSIKHFVFNAEVCHNVYGTKSSKGISNNVVLNRRCLFTRINFGGDTKTTLLVKL